MVLPVATARLLARSFRATLAVSIAVGLVSVVVGLALARVWSLAPGGAIVLVTALAFLIATIATGLRRSGSAGLLAGPGH
jgi:zinc transport system permease protein